MADRQTKPMCPVCAEPFTGAKRKPVECGACAFSACYGCTTRFLSESMRDPACMSCNHAWDRDFMIDRLTKGFVNGPLKKRREELLYEREQALLPATQPLVERVIRVEELKEVRAGLMAKKAELKRQLDEVARECSEVGLQIYRLEHTNVDLKTERRQFVRKCPADECTGFLSTQWKCGICTNYTCPDCHEVIGKDKKDAAHVCKPEAVETAKLLARDSKPCPGCSTLIFRISGCPQMFCTMCHTVFDWNTLQVETGRIHNPHFFEWQRTRAGGAAGAANPFPRPHGDMPCGGLPDVYTISTTLQRLKLNSKNVGGIDIVKYMQWVMHVYEYERRRYIVDNLMDNADLRVKYMRKEITMDRFKTLLQQREKARAKKVDIEQVMAMLFTVSGDILRNMTAAKHKDDVLDGVQELMRLVEFAQQGMHRIGSKYNSTAYNLAPTDRMHTFHVPRDT